MLRFARVSGNARPARDPLTFPGGAAHDPNDRPSPPGAGHAAGRRSVPLRLASLVSM